MGEKILRALIYEKKFAGGEQKTTACDDSWQGEGKRETELIGDDSQRLESPNGTMLLPSQPKPSFQSSHTLFQRLLK